mmetsp:Transcript_16029/g.41159  ORF Transcript_16029/g.41159 Transcript_16029/m.41159 type:complete len:551 (-) Transcript_16029:110-1762(-)
MLKTLSPVSSSEGLSPRKGRRAMRVDTLRVSRMRRMLHSEWWMREMRRSMNLVRESLLCGDVASSWLFSSAIASSFSSSSFFRLSTLRLRARHWLRRRSRSAVRVCTCSACRGSACRAGMEEDVPGRAGAPCDTPGQPPPPAVGESRQWSLAECASTRGTALRLPRTSGVHPSSAACASGEKGRGESGGPGGANTHSPSALSASRMLTFSSGGGGARGASSDCSGGTSAGDACAGASAGGAFTRGSPGGTSRTAASAAGVSHGGQAGGRAASRGGLGAGVLGASACVAARVTVHMSPRAASVSFTVQRLARRDEPWRSRLRPDRAGCALAPSPGGADAPCRAGVCAAPLFLPGVFEISFMAVDSELFSSKIFVTAPDTDFRSSAWLSTFSLWMFLRDDSREAVLFLSPASSFRLRLSSWSRLCAVIFSSLRWSRFFFSSLANKSRLLDDERIRPNVFDLEHLLPVTVSSGLSCSSSSCLCLSLLGFLFFFFLLGSSSSVNRCGRQRCGSTLFTGENMLKSWIALIFSCFRKPNSASCRKGKEQVVEGGRE